MATSDDFGFEDDDTAFIAKFRIPMFQKRMRILESINLEFIAKSAHPPYGHSSAS